MMDTSPSLDAPLPTFQRGSSSSTLDYMFGSSSIRDCIQTSNIEFINASWSDHALLSVRLRFGSGQHGKGLWRANPHLARTVGHKTAAKVPFFLVFVAHILLQWHKLPLFPHSKFPTCRAKFERVYALLDKY
ncbi:hypothetical protein G6F43_013298 [Rhizopus delemar]|nr:hypothetical protein G6F43_013298 [Rhizopus delemar]